VVRQGRLKDTQMFFVNPREPVFDPYYVSIHGITEKRVAAEPCFDVLWPRLKPILEGETLVAHYSQFDMSVLRHVLDDYGIPYPDLSYYRTWKLSRGIWPNLAAHRLNAVAEHLGIHFRHHNPLEDATVAARIAIRVCEELETASLEEAAALLSCGPGQLFPGGYRPSRSKNVKRGGRPDPKRMTPATWDFDMDHPLFGQIVVFTGALTSMARKDAMQEVINRGGQCGTAVTQKTALLVVGDQNAAGGSGGTRSSKLRRAEELAAAGFDIKVIGEKEFLLMLHA